MADKQDKPDAAREAELAERRKINKSMADSAAAYAASNQAEEDRLLEERVAHMGFDVVSSVPKSPSKKKKKGG